MATSARLLLLDEPAAGMNPAETHEITELIGKLRDRGGFTILVIEHDMHVVEGISDRVVALDHGVKIAEGTFDEVATRPGVIEAYLGRRPQEETCLRHSRARQRRHLLRPDPHPQDSQLEIDEGELVCLLGGNASGKSTTLKTILGIVRPATRHGPVRRRGRHRAVDQLTDRREWRSSRRTGACSRR